MREPDPTMREPDPTMRERTLTVSRTARYALLGTPSGMVDEVWLACHGYGQLASYFLRPFRAIETPSRLVVAPEALSRFYLGDDLGRHERVGASWMTRAARASEIDDYVGYLDAVYADVLAQLGLYAPSLARPVRLVAFGFSQGGATIARWLERSVLLDRSAAPADRLVLWGSALPHDLDLRAHAAWLRRLRLTLVAGREDELATPERLAVQAAALRAAEIPFETVPFAGGHRVEEAVLRGLAGA